MAFGLGAGSNLYADQQWNNQDAPGVQIVSQMVPQQPTTIFQQLQSPFFAFNQPNNFRSGHVKEDLVELMMIQNAQMHQVIMNNMTMSALSQFGYSEEPPASEIPSVPVIIEDTEQEVVYHHYYDPYSYQAPSVWQNPPRPPFQSNQKQIVRHLNDTNPAVLRELNPVPPPPPPSATGTVGADVLPATEYYDATNEKW
ncbi:proline-rich protein 29 isoform X2 [Protopterus annectens]|uniref:proline-rich protein 29 isoform X2 n=1 Tax=Protopterus annectens TaxID=7888 RepID=UPI001CFAEDBD|nr:proline-rich protein 29 isoform X2 [Protopterus annectens]